MQQATCSRLTKEKEQNLLQCIFGLWDKPLVYLSLSSYTIFSFSVSCRDFFLMPDLIPCHQRFWKRGRATFTSRTTWSLGRVCSPYCPVYHTWYSELMLNLINFSNYEIEENTLFFFISQSILKNVVKYSSVGFTVRKFHV